MGTDVWSWWTEQGRGYPGCMSSGELWAVTGTGRVARTSRGRGSSCVGAGGLGAQCVPGAQVGMVGMRAGGRVGTCE